MNNARRRAIILTATEEEYQAVRQHLDKSSIKEDPIRIEGDGYYNEEGKFCVNDGSWSIIIAITGQGNVKAASLTSFVIQKLKPLIILFLGTAGGLNTKDLELGDVVVVTTAFDHESGREEGVKFFARPVWAESDKCLIVLAKKCIREDKWRERISGRREEKEPSVHVGRVVSGSKIIASNSGYSYENIKENYNDALSVDKESYGFLEIAQSFATLYKQDIYAAVIRGIADFCEGKNEAERGNSKEIALKHASAFAFELIASFSLGQESSIHNKPQLTDTVVADDVSKSRTINQVGNS